MDAVARAHAEPSKWTVLALVGVGVFMCTLDTSIVNVSLPAIAQDFDVEVGARIEWVIIAYLVTIASTLLAVGRLADRYGHRSIWIAGMCLFTGGSALCGIAPSLDTLVGARVLQGFGGCALMAVSPAMLTAAFPGNERGRALGLNAMIVALGVTAGPTLGGALTQSASWRWIFYVNLPIGIVGVIASALLLPKSERTRGDKFDARGAVMLACALAGLTIALSIGNDAGWSSIATIVFAALFVVAGVVFAIHEARAKAPLLEPRLFANRVFASATASLVLCFLAAFALSFLLPFYFTDVKGDGPLRTGLSMTPFPLTFALASPFAGHLADRYGTRWLAAIGLAILCAGLVALAFIDEQTGAWGVVWRQMLAALGLGIFGAPNNSALMGAAPRDRQGVAAGMLATGRTMGQSISVAIAGAVFGALGGRSNFIPAFRGAMLTCAGIAAIGIFTSLLRGKDDARTSPSRS